MTPTNGFAGGVVPSGPPGDPDHARRTLRIVPEGRQTPPDHPQDTERTPNAPGTPHDPSEWGPDVGRGSHRVCFPIGRDGERLRLPDGGDP